MGDAAHATTPWQGSSTGMTFEDILILSTLLGAAKSNAEALAALKVYDHIRRPRTQDIVRSSRGSGGIMTGRNPEVKLDPEALRKCMTTRWDFIVDFDVKKHRDQAIGMMKEELEK